jgi:hypothetical protein
MSAERDQAATAGARAEAIAAEYLKAHGLSIVARNVRSRFGERKSGSLFGGQGSKVGVAIEDLLQAG